MDFANGKRCGEWVFGGLAVVEAKTKAVNLSRAPADSSGRDWGPLYDLNHLSNEKGATERRARLSHGPYFTPLFFGDCRGIDSLALEKCAHSRPSSAQSFPFVPVSSQLHVSGYFLWRDHEAALRRSWSTPCRCFSCI
jgi:hypothetical protein